MRVLVACEYSGIVRDAFIERGHEAISCDLEPSESDRGPHMQGDVLEMLRNDNSFDLMVGHPPCTYLSNSGGHYLKDNPERLRLMRLAANFFNCLLESSIPHIVLENPIQHGPARELIRKYDQIIQPYEYGEPHKKTMCLWLKNLDKLRPTKRLKVVPKKTYVKPLLGGLL